MPSCVVLNCNNRTTQKAKKQLEREKSEKISFFRFPRDRERTSLWLKYIDRQDLIPVKHIRICSDHFEKRFINSNLTLTRDAIPTIFLKFNVTKCSYQYVRKTIETEGSTPTFISMEEEDISNISFAPLVSVKLEEIPPTVIENKVPSTSFGQTPIDLECVIPSATIIIEKEKPNINRSIRPLSPTNTSLLKQLRIIKLKYRKQLKKIREANRRKTKISTKASLLKDLRTIQLKYKKQLKKVREANRRKTKRTASMKNVIESLTERQLISSENAEILDNIWEPNMEILDKAELQKYGTELRAFSLTLHYLSQDAYRFVRQHFNSSLPNPKTLTSWYTSVAGEPGFLSESLRAMKVRAELSAKPIICALSFDEMQIRRNIEFDGKRCHGYVDIGSGVENEKQAKSALVFMVVAINSSWKVPVGYFLIDTINVQQKANLLDICLKLIHNTGVRVVSLTYDGFNPNFTLIKRLGCVLDDSTNLKSHFKHPITCEPINVFPDPSQMIKFVRNTIAEKKIIYENKFKIIKWSYIEKLHEVQEKEGLHLRNKLSGKRYSKEKKVELATQQSLSKSVVTAMRFCNKKLNLDEFKKSEATIKFINIFNDLFDIFNSKQIYQCGFTKPIGLENSAIILKKLDEAADYINGLHLNRNEKLVDSNRKMGFLGFLICISSLKEMYNRYCVESNTLQYIPTYKMSQDHIQLLFSIVEKSYRGFDFPTSRQFKSALKKILKHTEIKDGSSLENINILHCAPLDPKSIHAIEIINRSSRNFSMGEIESDDDDNAEEQIDDINLSNFTENVTSISKLVVRRLKTKLKCDVCLSVIEDQKDSKPLAFYLDKGDLIYPSKDVTKICSVAEKQIILGLNESGGTMLLKKFTHLYFVTHSLETFLHSDIFSQIQNHMFEQHPFENHIVQLIRAVLDQYVKIRLNYIPVYPEFIR